jgi:Transposase DDE domain
MLLEDVFNRFVTKSPVTVMARALLENALSPSSLDELFGRHAEVQYERKLLFSSVVDLMSLVVCKIQPSVSAAYRAVEDTLPVSLASFYDKLNGIEGGVTAAMVRHTATQLGPVIEAMGGQLPPLLPGYRVKILDGNHLAATERRLSVLHRCHAGPLPGHALVVLDPALMLITDMVPCEDGHAQERSLLPHILNGVAARDLWIGDRNFCTVGFLGGIAKRGAFFNIRQHANFPIASYGTLHSRGRCTTGDLFEQRVTFLDAEDVPRAIRRIVVRLDKPTRDGATEIALLTNVPVADATAQKIAELYSKRWTLEGAFQMLTQTLNGEIATLGYPKAALFAFGVALVSYNVAGALRAALRAKFGHDTIEPNISAYYIASEVQITMGGLDVVFDDIFWTRFQTMTAAELAKTLLDYAGHVRLRRFARTRRGPKQPVPPRTRHRDEPHVSTARLLARAGHKA